MQQALLILLDEVKLVGFDRDRDLPALDSEFLPILLLGLNEFADHEGIHPPTAGKEVVSEEGNNLPSGKVVKLFAAEVGFLVYWSC